MSGELKAIDLTQYPDPALRKLLAGFGADHIAPLSLRHGLSGCSFKISKHHRYYHLRLWPQEAHPGQQQVPAQLAQQSASLQGLAPQILNCGDGWTLSSWVDGDVLSQRECLVQADLVNLSFLFVQLVQSSPWQHKATHRLTELINWYQQRLPALDDALLPVAKLIVEAEPPSSCLSVVHLDISLANIVDSGCFKLIDWEYAGVTDWHWALANMLSHFSSSDQHVICDRLINSGLDIDFSRLAYYELGVSLLSYQWVRWQRQQQPELISINLLETYRCELMQHQTKYLQGVTNGTGHY